MNTANENMLKGKWKEIKGNVQSTWGKLTDDELEQTKGDMKAIGGLIQQRYGDAQDTYSTKLKDIFKKFETTEDDSDENMEESLKS